MFSDLWLRIGTFSYITCATSGSVNLSKLNAIKRGSYIFGYMYRDRIQLNLFTWEHIIIIWIGLFLLFPKYYLGIQSNNLYALCCVAEKTIFVATQKYFSFCATQLRPCQFCKYLFSFIIKIYFQQFVYFMQLNEGRVGIISIICIAWS